MEKFLIVNAKVLPDYFEKILEVRTLIDTNQNLGIKEACTQVGISRSTFYKYKDHIFSLNNNPLGRKAEIHFLLSHKQGVLSNVLNKLSENSCNILAIHQSIPLNNIATLSIQVDISDIVLSIDEIIETLKTIKGVKKVKLISLE